MMLFFPIGVQFKSDSHKMKHSATCPLCQNGTPRQVPLCQNETPRRVPTHSGVTTPNREREIHCILKKRNKFSNHSNMMLFIPIAVVGPECVTQNKTPRHVPFCQNETPRLMPLAQNKTPRHVPLRRNRTPRQMPDTL